MPTSVRSRSKRRSYPAKTAQEAVWGNLLRSEPTSLLGGSARRLFNPASLHGVQRPSKLPPVQRGHESAGEIGLEPIVQEAAPHRRLRCLARSGFRQLPTLATVPEVVGGRA